MRRHDAFLSGFDLANFDQVLWLFANGHEPLNTQDGQLFWGEHFSPTITAFVPAYALGAGPTTLLVVQGLSVALVAPLLFFLARTYGAGPRLAAIPAVLWLLSPMTLLPTVNDVHHVPLVAPAIVGSILALKRGQLPLFVVLALLACGAKEDVSLMYLALGVVVALEGRRRLGEAIVVGSLAIFLFAVVVFLPAFSDSIAWFEDRFAGDRGDTVADALGWIVLHPWAALGDLVVSENLVICAALVVGTGGLCWLAPRWMLLGVPALAHSLLSAYEPQHQLGTHYYFPVSIAFAVAAAVGVGRLAGAAPRLRRVAAVCIAAAALVAPLGIRSVVDESSWAPEDVAALGGTDVRRLALAHVPDNVSVAASTRLTPHLAHRREIYTLPLPFFGRQELGTDWSAEEFRARAAGVRWVVLDMSDRRLLFPRTPERMRSLLPRLGFRPVFEAGSVSVWRC